jgi:hypothetical protein
MPLTACQEKRIIKMFRAIDKILAVCVFAPPLYMLFRFVRWWIRQESEPEADHEVDPAGSEDSTGK